MKIDWKTVIIDFIKGKYLPLSKRRRKMPVEPWAFIRVKNEMATLKQCLDSIVPVIKKGVIGYHRLAPGEKDDGTEEYIREFCKKNPGFILYKHDYEIIPACDARYKELDKICEENTLAGYYNAVLKQIPEGEWLIKIDGDHIYDTHRLEKLMYLPKEDNEIISISRFNLHYDREKLYVRKNFPIYDPCDHWLIKNRNLKFYMDCGYDNGKFYAWEKLNIGPKLESHELVWHTTDLFNWHFPCVKQHRLKNLESEEFIDFDRFKVSFLERKLVYHIDDYMLDKEIILNICKKINFKK